MQGGPSSRAPTEPHPGPVPAAAGANDEPPGEDDPASCHRVSPMGPERGEGSRETIKHGRGGGVMIFLGTRHGIASPIALLNK